MVNLIRGIERTGSTSNLSEAAARCCIGRCGCSCRKEVAPWHAQFGCVHTCVVSAAAGFGCVRTFAGRAVDRS